MSGCERNRWELVPGEPVWVTAETQGMVTASIFRVESDVAIQRIRPSYWKKYDADIPNDSRVDEVVQRLRLCLPSLSEMYSTGILFCRLMRLCPPRTGLTSLPSTSQM